MMARSVEAKGVNTPEIAHIPMEIVQRIPGENDVLEKVPIPRPGSKTGNSQVMESGLPKMPASSMLA
jgi:hypothetical protein